MTRVLTDSGTSTIRISVLVLNVAKATAGVMENPARDLVALLVLDRLAQACQVGSIAKPPNRTAKAKHFCGNLQPIQLQIPGGIPEFFLADCDFVFGARMSHFGSNCLANSASYGGEFGVAWPLRLCNRAIAKTQTAMSATYALIAKSKGFTDSVQFLRGSHEYGLREYRYWRDSTRAQHDCKGAKARGAQLREIA